MSSDPLIHVSRRAMACEFEVRFPAKRCPQGTPLALDALDLVEALEEEISYFRPTSQISRINLLAAERPVEVSPALFDLLSLSAALGEETEGAYDITSAALGEVWGFARRKGEIPSEAALAEAKTRVGGHLVELDPVRRTIRFRRSGVRISLSGIGKGHALDVCAERLLALGMTDFLLHGGQSGVLARGRPSSPTGGQTFLPASDRQERLSSCNWEIGLRHPRQPERRLGVVRLQDRALGTSSGQFQSFRHRGRRYGHILDPRSGRPAEGVLSATVLAPTAALADALSTAFYVLGPAGSRDYCRRHPDVGAVILCPGSGGEDLETYAVGLAEGVFADAHDACRPKGIP